MKKYFLLLCSALILPMADAMPYDGIVIVLEAPLLREPSLGSVVLQVIRKGHRVFVPNEIGDQSPLPEFIPTFDRAGNPAYIPSQYVKVVTGKITEDEQPITLAGHDPTDYRLEEPISSTYPFEDQGYVRASFALGVGSNANSAYEYNTPFNKQDYGKEIGLRFNLTHKISFDQYDRYYFGLIGSIGMTENKIDFRNASSSTENYTTFRAGPWFTYDAYKNEKCRLSVGTGFTFNYHQSAIDVSNSLSNAEEKRIFSGLSLSPMTSTTFQVSDVIPNMDLISGVDFTLFLPYNLKNSTQVLHPELWGESNQITSPMRAQASLFMGMQFHY